MKSEQQLISIQKSIIIIQKWYRGYLTRKLTKKIAKKLHDRKKIIQQLVLTQQKYIHDIGIIVSDFQTNLINHNIITQSQGYIIFCNIEAIRKLNEQFFTVLYNHFQQYKPYKIIFEDVKKQTYFFKIYFQYLNNFTNSMSKIKYLKENNIKFLQFLAKIRKNKLYGNLQLQDYLIKPVQRLPKYVLLLKQLIKKTQQSHPDYENITKVLEIIEQVNCSNNDKLNKVINNFKLSQLQKQVTLPFNITQPGTQFILQQNVTILSSSSRIIDNVIMYLLNNRIILTKRLKNRQKYLDSVSFKYGTNIMQNQEQQTYSYCFTVQSIDGDSITFLCKNQEEKIGIIQNIHLQIIEIQKKTYEKYSALQSHNQITQSFLKKISRYDLNLQIVILGTQQRNDKMLKYTTYIIEVKVKNVRQKIFLRYSQILQIQNFICQQFPKIQIKQSLYKTTWLLNHKPRTIQERKISIQKFLQQVLSKPEIIQHGCKVLSKLGLPQDFYQLPLKFKNSQTIVKKNSFNHTNSFNNSNYLFSKKQMETTQGGTSKGRKTYRLSIFQDLSDEQQKPQKSRKNSTSYNQDIKLSGHKHGKKLSIHQLLQANQLNLGHFIRYSQNIDCIAKKQIKVQIYLPWLQNQKGIIRKTISIFESQRVAVLIKKLSKQINLNYYKDFRLFLQKEYTQRILDDDQIILKIQNQIITGKYRLIFKKMIYIDKQSEQNQLKKDKLRLKIIASQIVYQIKKSKYKLPYKKLLILAVLIGIIQQQTKKLKEGSISQEQGSIIDETRQINYQNLALITRQLLTNPYDSFYEKDKIWIQDYKKIYQNIYCKLKKISLDNASFVRTSLIELEQNQIIWTSLIQLSYLSIVDQIKKNQLFGSMCHIVQISEEFRQKLYNQLDQSLIDQNFQQIEKQSIQNRNIWLIIKCNQIFLYSINLKYHLFEIKYDSIDKILCYPSSIIINLRNSLNLNEPLKLKTTNSFSIRQLLNYYKNYNEMSKKIEEDMDYTQSLLEIIQQNQKYTINQDKEDKDISMELVEQQLQ